MEGIQYCRTMSH